MGADGLQGFPKETGTERSEVEARGFKSHPRHQTIPRAHTEDNGSNADARTKKSDGDEKPLLP